jgi:hypothetical protein
LLPWDDYGTIFPCGSIIFFSANSAGPLDVSDLPLLASGSANRRKPPPPKRLSPLPVAIWLPQTILQSKFHSILIAGAFLPLRKRPRLAIVKDRLNEGRNGF